jgi:addiction module HigA family antidote
VEIVDDHGGNEIVTRKDLITLHPGEFLAEMLGELGLSQAAFARAIGPSPMRTSDVVKGTRPVTAELALLFGRAFEQSPQYWLNHQSDHDLETAEASIGPRLRAIHSVAHAQVVAVPLEVTRPAPHRACVHGRTPRGTRGEDREARTGPTRRALRAAV